MEASGLCWPAGQSGRYPSSPPGMAVKFSEYAWAVSRYAAGSGNSEAARLPAGQPGASAARVSAIGRASLDRMPARSDCCPWRRRMSLMSSTRSVLSVAYALMSPSAPAGTMIACGSMRPSSEFSVRRAGATVRRAGRVQVARTRCGIRLRSVREPARLQECRRDCRRWRSRAKCLPAIDGPPYGPLASCVPPPDRVR